MPRKAMTADEWEQKMEKLFDRPITEEGADLLARRLGYRFAGYYDTGDPQFADRFAAIFLPDPDDRSHAIITDGRTRNRALRRGLYALEHGGWKQAPDTTTDAMIDYFEGGGR